MILWRLWPPYLFKHMRKVLVIGGGAAGMMAAYSAALNDCEVTLLEQNEKLGKKVYITGKGRCNVTNAGDTSDFFNSVNSNPKFLYSSIYGYDAFMLMDTIESMGCPLKTERGNRVFPVSDHSSDIIRAFENALIGLKVRILKNTAATELKITDGEVRGVYTDSGYMEADRVICATGGISYPYTGSDGRFNGILSGYGIEYTKMYPGLVPLVSPDKICEKLMGLSLKNVSLDLYVDNKNIYSGFGEMLFTHFGISGPLCLTASLAYNKKYFGKKAKAVIDLKPALDNEKLDERILRDFASGPNKAFSNIIDGLLPKSFAARIPELTGIPGTKKVHDITAEERKKLVSILKGFTIDISGSAGFNEAIITIGGVNVRSINPSTMESKIIKNLYFAGEMIDVDACTGGYNLQIAWSTGHLAGESASL